MSSQASLVGLQARAEGRAFSLPLPVVGNDLTVPLVTGERVRYVHLDSAASTPCLRAVHEAVNALLPWYAGVHRGDGFTSTVMTELYEDARAAIRHFVGARSDDAVVFTRNTTDALNLLASALPEGTSVVTFASEHHANLLPWRRGDHVHLPIPASPDEAIALADRALGALQGKHRVLSVAGASNVTGEVWPLAELAAVACARGARFVVDAAQLAPHRTVDMAALGIDYLALSGHKLYAPFGSGVLVGRADWLDGAQPYLAGGGAVRRVTVGDVEWIDGPARHEGGSPNVLGALSLAAACRALSSVGMDRIETYERGVFAELTQCLHAHEDVAVVSMWGSRSDRVGVATFTVARWAPGALAAALSAEHGIGVRAGAFCAHPLVSALVNGAAEEDCGAQGAARASIGAGTSYTDISRFRLALSDLVEHGARWSYRASEGRYVPDPDPRTRPVFPTLA
jgi:selenocysteine lyase/cysteine desulfurase